MPTYKGYSKQATSDKMMRIIKRERILSIIIAGYQSGYADLRRVHPTPAGIKRSDMSWHDANLTKLTIRHHISHQELFDYKLRIIEETGWLKNSHPRIYKDGDMLVAEWSDTRKLRIYYDWLHKSRNFTLERVLKYMYSPLFMAMYLLDQGLNVVGGRICIYTGFSGSKETERLNEWIHDILGCTTYVIKHDDAQDIILIEDEYKEAFLNLIEPLIKELPDTYQTYYKNEALQLA